MNSLGLSSPGGKNWSSTTVFRLLFDKVHLGKIVFGKQKGSGHKNRKHKPYQRIAEKNWIVVDGRHTPIKTQEEHDRIVELFAKRKKIPKAARNGAKEFSGLVYCGKCGYSMQFTENGTSGEIYVKRCQKSDPVGHHCGNRGVNIKILEEAVFSELHKHQVELENRNFDVIKTELSILKDGIAEKRKRIEVEKGALDVIQTQSEEKLITEERYSERKAYREGNIERLLQEIKELEERCAKRQCATDEKRLHNIEEFYRLWNNANSVQEKNIYLRSIVDKITYVREQCEEDSKHVKVMVNFPSAYSVSTVA